MKQLYVKGRIDGILRPVEHIPVDMHTRQTACGPGHYRMRLLRDGQWVPQIINADRIISKEEDRYGHPELGALRRAP